MYTIYRIEHTTKDINNEKIGKGCYINRELFSAGHDMSMAHNVDTHPSIREDIQGWSLNDTMYRECFCAFDSMEKLNKWFRGWKTKLLKEDFIVMSYSVREYTNSISGKQILFSPNDIVETKIVQNKLGIVK